MKSLKELLKRQKPINEENTLTRESLISEMATDIINISQSIQEMQLEISPEIYQEIKDVYTKLDSIHEALSEIDDKQKEVVAEIAEGAVTDEFSEPTLSEEETFSPKTLALFKKLMFKPAPINSKTYKSNYKKVKVATLYGIPMRAGKWSDIFVGQFEDGKYFILDATGTYIFKSEADFAKTLKQISTVGFDESTGVNEEEESIPSDLQDTNELVEKLGPDASIEDYIDDFIKSDAPQFSGKSKKERIKMALGAYYGAQKKEDVNEGLTKDDDLATYIYDFIAADTEGKPVKELIALAIGAYYGSQKNKGLFEGIQSDTNENVNEEKTIADSSMRVSFWSKAHKNNFVKKLLQSKYIKGEEWDDHSPTSIIALPQYAKVWADKQKQYVYQIADK